MTDSNFHITTPRLYLSRFQANSDVHCDFLLELYNTPEIFKGNGGVAKQLDTREDARKSIILNSERQEETGYGRYIISLRPIDSDATPKSPFAEIKDTLVKIGLVSLKVRKHPDAPKVPDLGFHLFPKYWGKGYATEAVTATIEYFEKERGLKDLAGYCNPDNEESKKMFRRLGFIERGQRLLKLGGQLDDPGVNALVWTRAGMTEDLTQYGL